LYTSTLVCSLSNLNEHDDGGKDGKGRKRQGRERGKRGEGGNCAQPKTEV